MLQPWNLPNERPMHQPDANVDDPSRGRRPATNPFPDSFAPDRRVIEGSSTELADETRDLLHRRLRAGGTIRCRQFGVSSPLLLLPLHQVGKLDSWEDFQNRQAMTLFTTRSTAGTTEPMSSAPTANGICSLAISPAPRHGTLSRSSATA